MQDRSRGDDEVEKGENGSLGSPDGACNGTRATRVWHYSRMETGTCVSEVERKIQDEEKARGEETQHGLFCRWARRRLQIHS